MDKGHRNLITELSDSDKKVINKYTRYYSRYYSSFIESSDGGAGTQNAKRSGENDE